jgi:hypothetical protein
MNMPQGLGKGWTKAGTYSNKKQAIKRAKELRGKFNRVQVKRGTHGVAWFKPRTVYRIWVK